MSLETMNPTDFAFWNLDSAERDSYFARIRKAARAEPLDVAGVEGTFYALARHDDVAEASRRPELFSSEPIATSLADPPEAARRFFGAMISMDDPRHARLRRIVSRAFTPRMIGGLRGTIEREAVRIADDLADRGPCDFVEHVARPLPLFVICTMMGIPEERYGAVLEASEIILAMGDPGFVPPDGRDRVTVMAEKFGILHGMMAELAAERRERPADDLVTALVNADVDGQALTAEELGKLFGLLVVAGTETTRTTLSHVLTLLTEHEEQRELLLSGLDERLPGTVEESLRYASPVSWMRRTLTRDLDFAGRSLREGDRVLLYYCSANRDELAFHDPGRFDITRSPNPHVAFGAPGPHFCLGANLARLELTTLLRELFTRFPGLHAAAAPVRQPSTFVNGVARLDCAF
ncbi:cytochrome P450 [Actinocorallia longicatena]|uniref:Cytochrome P450 n=1 Tax=Actinocorallia longicatena TaxID=111803 RepID=A0ABP6QAD0_9ACTN